MRAQFIWNAFCARFNIAKECVPLFESTTNGIVATKTIGKAASTRSVLARSAEMEEMILRETEKLLEDWKSKQHKLDGLIYCMGWKQHGHFIPLYIGKTEKGFDFLGYRFKPQKLLEPAVQSLTRLLERARRLHEKGADSHRLRQYVQRWVTWLHGGLQGAVTENRFNQIWAYVNLKLSG